MCVYVCWVSSSQFSFLLVVSCMCMWNLLTACCLLFVLPAGILSAADTATLCPLRWGSCVCWLLCCVDPACVCCNIMLVLSM